MKCGECLMLDVKMVDLIGGVCPTCGADYRKPCPTCKGTGNAMPSPDYEKCFDCQGSGVVAR